MKNNETKKVIISIVAVVLIIAIVSGGTYSYWSWQTSNGSDGGGNDQQTYVDVTVAGGSLTISGTNVNQSGVTLYPVSKANCTSNALVGTATVTAINETESPMTVTLKLKASLTATQGTLTTTNKAYLKWAVVETDSAFSSTTTCANATYNGTFSTVTTNTDLDTGITFTATATSTTGTGASTPVTTTKYYKVYVWLDSGYEYTNTGTVVSDPMQNLKIVMTWSQNSTMIQHAS